MVIFILKAIILLASMGLALAYLVIGIWRKNNKHLRKAGLIFFAGWFLLMIISGLELIILQK